MVALSVRPSVPQDGPMQPRRDTASLAAVALAFLAVTLVAISAGIAFGYDESVYAGLTRHWLTGAPSSGWDLHRPPGLSVLALVPQAAGLDAEWAHRLIGAAAGLGVVLAAWWAARTIGGAVAGLVAAVALAGSTPLQVESASFLTDVPSTLVLLVLAVLAWRHVRGPSPIGRSFVWLGFLAAAAFYLRYGSIVESAAIGAACAIVAPRRLVEAWPIVAGAALAFVLALVPHVTIALAETGTPWGILAAAGRAAGGGESLPLLSYVRWLPWQLIGPLGAVIAVVGIIGAVRHARTSAFARFAGVTVLVAIAFLGTLVHAEPRYVLFPMTLLVVLGSVEVAALVERVDWRGRAAVVSVAIACLILAAATTSTEIRTRADLFNWKRDVGVDIATVAGPPRLPDCSIIAADVPIMSWYSGCPADNVAWPEGLVASWRFVVDAEGDAPPPEDIGVLTEDAKRWGTYVDGSGRPAAVVYLLAD
jgi:hypothetical protein